MSRKLRQLRACKAYRQAAYIAAQEAGASKRHLRNLRRALARTSATVSKAQRKRRICAAVTANNLRRIQLRRQQKCKRKIRIATWNSRGLGALQGKYPLEIKIKCFIHRMQVQQWGCLVLTDVKGLSNPQSFMVDGRSWLLIPQGKNRFPSGRFVDHLVAGGW